jgi:hypothetical protein
MEEIISAAHSESMDAGQWKEETILEALGA